MGGCSRFFSRWSTIRRSSIDRVRIPDRSIAQRFFRPTPSRRGREGLHRATRSGPCVQEGHRHKIEPDRPFYPAENYHQDFLTRNPKYPYIVINDLPKIEDLKHDFPDLYRASPVLVAGRAVVAIVNAAECASTSVPGSLCRSRLGASEDGALGVTLRRSPHDQSTTTRTATLEALASEKRSLSV